MRKKKVIEELREPKILKKIADLKNLGLSDEEITKIIKEKFDIEFQPSTVSRILRKYTITRKEIFISDQEFRSAYKTMLMDMIRQGKESSKIMEDTLNLVYQKLNQIEKQEASSLEIEKLKWYIEELKSTDDWVKVRNQIIQIIKGFQLIRHKQELVIFIREVCSAIRALNDSLRTRNDILKSLELETKEVKLNAVQSAQMTLNSLQELEKAKLIEIKPTYYELEVNIEKKKKGGKEDEDRETEQDNS